MFKLLKNAEVYAPEYLGKKDILLFGEKIAKIGDNITIPEGFLECETVDFMGKILVPGFIDQHVHIIGGGGEGGFSTRTPEIHPGHIVTAGITTVVGLLGTDGTTRHMSSLLAKARALEEEGITAYIYTGSYQVPARSLTENPRNDIILIDKVLGIGEIAVSDHRSAQPTVDDLLKLASEARVGGLLSGKAGVLHMHIGDGKRKLSQLFEMLEVSEIPITQYVPTHLNRNKALFSDGIKFALMGGIVDITASINLKGEDRDAINPSEAIRLMLESGVNIDNITMSSDGNGSTPMFDDSGKLVGIGIGSLNTLHKAFQDAVLREKVPLELALRTITSNVARVLKLNNKGVIKAGCDADIVVLNKGDLEIDTVMARGQWMIKERQVLKSFTFTHQAT
ncbi:beta-aspartyl-dipeptidase (metallo-type) [Caldanaerobius fijiensis DSM 17918]|uniref:Isoaspartyl dipeptidase n=1 Tax=Caldanaerobius fijiensis DSM 17918 TaxID=1121256 RepID=A0A1M4Z4E9_9THEO|nr:beta-aspartyl-peptidase [Caldanaerobius fijiensis]SHF12828.1 beta-aspartyl-dipeptidase (metallo-type) [Caldanaerobius fijiensis DSM 17918]